jgi:predicted nucleotidyltransferase
LTTQRAVGISLQDLRAHRAELLRIATAHGARSIRVFGSVARGQARPDSDVDFLVEFQPDRTVLDLSSLILDLEAALGRKVDVVETTPPSPFVARIEREAVPL